jgi:transposase
MTAPKATSDRSGFAAFVGIDWADREHAVCLLVAGGSQFEHEPLLQQAEAIDGWVARLRERFGGRPIAVCLEQSRGALAYALMKYDCLVLFPINPKQLAKYRQAFTPSGAKDDPIDAGLLCQFVVQHYDRLRAWRPDDVATRGLRLLSEARRKWVDQRTALGNQLLQVLKESYPAAEALRGKQLCTARFLALLQRFPSQPELQRAGPRQLLKYLPRRRRVIDDSAEQPHHDPRIVAIRAARLLTTDAAILGASRLAICHLVALLRQLNRTVDDYDRQIAALLGEHPDAELFASLPGAGAALTPRLVAAFGTDRSRYESAEPLQQLSGAAPITVRSGKACAVRKRRACSKFLRQTFHEFARCSTGSSAWARAYCAMMRARGHGFHSAIRALAYKWLRILFRCWQTHEPYDEARYLQQLRRNNSPLIAYLKARPALPNA